MTSTQANTVIIETIRLALAAEAEKNLLDMEELLQSLETAALNARMIVSRNIRSGRALRLQGAGPHEKKFGEHLDKWLSAGLAELTQIETMVREQAASVIEFTIRRRTLETALARFEENNAYVTQSQFARLTREATKALPQNTGGEGR